MSKYYQVKVYTKENVYLTTWSDIVSDIEFNNEINSAGGQMKITLARNAGDYGEGSDVDFGHRVKVYVFDKEVPDGLLIFQGYISAYTPIYKDDKVDVTLLSYGSELNDYIIEGGEAFNTSQTSETDTIAFGSIGFSLYTVNIAQTITANSNFIIERFEIKLQTGNGYDQSTGQVVERTNVPVIAKIRTGSTAGSGTLLGESNIVEVLDNTMRPYSFVFKNDISLTNTSTYNIVIEPLQNAGADDYTLIATTGNNNYSGGSLWSDLGKVGSPEWSNLSSRDLWFRLYERKVLTYAEYLSLDPASILKFILDKYQSFDGNVSYSNTTIDLTDTEVTYQYNVNTILEGINKCVELAPKDWYWYLDYGTNLIHFHKKNELPDHIFSLESDVIDAQFEKRIEDITNTIYFTGGEISGGNNFFKKYINQDSIDKYGIKSMKYTDQRVTVENTADTIANSILETKSQPELRVKLEILDSNNNQGLGYDIESIKVGDTVAVRNITQQVGLSTWDYARWDESYWDYNIYNLSSLTMQVIKLTYKQDSVLLEASTIPVDVNKRIEDINRNLETLQTLNNPIAPE